MTCEAPLSSHCRALSALIPPPSCMPPGQAASASSAARSLPGPSIMICPPIKLSAAIEFGKPRGGFSATKLVCTCLRGVIFQCRADNLFHNSPMEIDTRSEFHIPHLNTKKAGCLFSIPLLYLTIPYKQQIPAKTFPEELGSSYFIIQLSPV